MKLRCDFDKWLADLCDYYSRADWFTPENKDATWRDVRGVELDALEEIGVWIRTNVQRWPQGFSISGTINRAWAVVSANRARERAKQELAEQSKGMFQTAEQAARSQQRCRELIQGLRTGKRPPWAGEPRAETRAGHTDAYHRGGRDEIDASQK